MTDARQVLALAEAAGSARAVSDEAAGAALRAMENDVVPALDYFLDNDHAAALRLVAALSGFWQDTGRVDEGRALTERVLAATMPRAARDRDVAGAIPGALLAASELAFRQGDQKQATTRANQAIRAAMLVEDRPAAALGHTALARVAYRARDAAEIERQAQLALELADDDSAATRAALHMLAWPPYFAGDLDEAERLFEASLEYRREHGLRFSVAVEITNLGELAVEQGDLARAALLASEAMVTCREIGSIFMIVNLLASLAMIAVRADDPQAAARLFGAGKVLGDSAGLIADADTSIAEAVAAARASLGDARYEDLAAEGGALSMDAAIDLGLSVARRIQQDRGT